MNIYGLPRFQPWFAPPATTRLANENYRHTWRNEWSYYAPLSFKGYQDLLSAYVKCNPRIQEAYRWRRIAESPPATQEEIQALIPQLVDYMFPASLPGELEPVSILKSRNWQ